MDAETIGALEEALYQYHHSPAGDDPQYEVDAALIRALIERERNGGERAQIVAWLRQEYVDIMDAAHGNAEDILQAEVVHEITDAIAAGAHKQQIITGQSEESEHVAED
jgi:hypothetical protein